MLFYPAAVLPPLALVWPTRPFSLHDRPTGGMQRTEDAQTGQNTAGDTQGAGRGGLMRVFIEEEEGGGGRKKLGCGGADRHRKKSRQQGEANAAERRRRERPARQGAVGCTSEMQTSPLLHFIKLKER